MRDQSDQRQYCPATLFQPCQNAAELRTKDLSYRCYHSSLREKTAGVSIIKAFVIDNEAASVRANAFPCDSLLLDGGLGQGEKFDWKLISKMERPFFLAGGLSADNVNEAIKTTKPFAVDVSSGVETEGFKDSKKIKHFIDKVREEI